MKRLTRIRTLARVRALPEVDLPEVAQSASVIIDGDGRWASRRGLPPAADSPPARAVRPIVEAPIELGVHDLSVFAFSTGELVAAQDEVDALMEIFAETIERELPDLAGTGRARALHRRRDRAPRVAPAHGGDGGSHRAEHAINLWVAFDYGGRAELVEAARRIVESGVEPRRSTRTCSPRTSTRPSCRIPTFSIRTSGELRISNFLLWQLAYTELVFVDKLWPDFDERDLRSALAEYASGAVEDSAADDPFWSRIVIALAVVPVVLGAVYVGGWWLFALVTARGERCAAPVSVARAPAASTCAGGGYVGGDPRLVGAQQGGVKLDVGGLLTTLVLAFPVKAISERRAGGDGCVSGTFLGARRMAASRPLILVVAGQLPHDGRCSRFTVVIASWRPIRSRTQADAARPPTVCRHGNDDVAEEDVAGIRLRHAAAVFVMFIALYKARRLTIAHRSCSADRCRRRTARRSLRVAR